MPALNQPAGPSGQGPAGLTTAQVRKRIQAGQVNTPPESPTKTVKRIVLENLFSFFNIIFYIIAGFLIAVGSFGELIFLLVVAANTAIGIIQELHARKNWTPSPSSLPHGPKWFEMGSKAPSPPATWYRMTWSSSPPATKFRPMPKWSPAVSR